MDKETIREALINYYVGGAVSSTSLATFLNKDEEEVSSILGQFSREYSALPCDDEGATKEQENQMSNLEDKIIHKLLTI